MMVVMHAPPDYERRRWKASAIHKLSIGALLVALVSSCDENQQISQRGKPKDLDGSLHVCFRDPLRYCS